MCICGPIPETKTPNSSASCTECLTFHGSRIPTLPSSSDRDFKALDIFLVFCTQYQINKAPSNYIEVNMVAPGIRAFVIKMYRKSDIFKLILKDYWLWKKPLRFNLSDVFI